MNSRSVHGVLALAISVLLVLFVATAGTSVSAAEGQGAGPSVVVATETPAVAPQLDLSQHFPNWAQREVAGIAVWQFVSAFVLILLGLVLKKVSDLTFERKLIPLLEKTPFAIDNLLASAISKPLGYLFLLGGVSGALAVLPLPAEPNVRGFVFGALKVLAAALLLWFLFRVVDVVVEHLGRLAERTESKLDDQLLPLVRKALKATIGVVCFVWVIQLLGYSVSSLLAGLGIGGLAVALALQDTLANFFGSIFIFLDRPFTVGDWIKVAGTEGTVEQIGFRTTRIRTWPATLVSIPNKTVANEVIDNWSRMPKRRVSQAIGVTYETRADQMQNAVSAIRGILEGDEGVDQEFMLIRFTDFGEFSLNILVYYFTRDITWDEHLATKERVNLAIMSMLEELGLSIAFPTRTIHLREGADRSGHARADEAPPSAGRGATDE